MVYTIAMDPSIFLEVSFTLYRDSTVGSEYHTIPYRTIPYHTIPYRAMLMMAVADGFLWRDPLLYTTAMDPSICLEVSFS